MTSEAEAEWRRKVKDFTRAVWIVCGGWLVWVGWASLPSGHNPNITKAVILVGLAEWIAALTPWRLKPEAEAEDG